MRKCEDTYRYPRPIRVMHVFGGQVRSGIESHVLTLAEGFRGTCVDTLLVTLMDGPFLAELRERGFKVDVVGKKRKYDFLAIPKLAHLIQHHKVDLVHSHAENAGFYARPAGRMVGVRGNVSTIHAYTKVALRDRYKSNFIRTLVHKHNLLTSKLCDGLITVNADLKEMLIREGINPSKVVFIPNAINLKVFDPTKFNGDSVRAELKLPLNIPVVGTAGRLAPVKNLHLFLRSAKKLIQRGEEVRFVIIGDGPLQTELRSFADQLGVSDHVIFTGWRDDIPRVLSAIDIFALSSITETGPIAALEAMALTKPVVACDVGAVPEAVQHNGTGFLVASEDVMGFTEAIAALLRDGNLARRMGLAGRKVVERKFSSPNVVRRTMDFYFDVLTKKRG